MSDIAKTLGRPRTSDISVVRNELIKKGLVYAPERGLLAFTVPGMSDFRMSPDGNTLSPNVKNRIAFLSKMLREMGD